MAALRIAVAADGGDVELAADWTDDAPRTRRAVADALPVAGDAARWGDELYLDVPVDVDPDPEQTRTVVDVGSVAYWPAGRKLCLFWGPTPASEGSEPRAAAPVAVVASVRDTAGLERVDGAAHVRVERA
jgi:hypothetical protein